MSKGRKFKKKKDGVRSNGYKSQSEQVPMKNSKYHMLILLPPEAKLNKHPLECEMDLVTQF